MAPVRVTANILLTTSFCSWKDLLSDPESECQPRVDAAFLSRARSPDGSSSRQREGHFLTWNHGPRSVIHSGKEAV